jgi:molecular chaperone DnaJ
LEHEISIDLLSALKGFDTEIALEKPRECEACQGTGQEPGVGMSVCPTCGGSGRVNIAEGPIRFTRACPRCGGHGRLGRPCSRCGGSGRVNDTEWIRVSIPQGVKDGSKVRVAGKGEPGRNGGPAGDLYLVVRVKPHPVLKREGDNLYMELPVTVGEAMAGAAVKVPTVDGPVNIKVPPKSQSGQTLRLKGKGAYNPKTKSRGDLMVKLVVKVPKTEDQDALESAKKMESLYSEDVRAGVRL